MTVRVIRGLSLRGSMALLVERETLVVAPCGAVRETPVADEDKHQGRQDDRDPLIRRLELHHHDKGEEVCGERNGRQSLLNTLYVLA
jgi:hypothetical protein